jgi:acyl dehydratase
VTFEKGQTFGEVRFELTPEAVRDYVAAVEDGAVTALGKGAVPPMAIAAYAVRGLLSEMPLPPGSIHAGQELEFLRPARLGDALSVTGRVLSAGERKGWTLATVALDVRDGAGEPVMRGRATLTTPAEPS